MSEREKLIPERVYSEKESKESERIERETRARTVRMSRRESESQRSLH